MASGTIPPKALHFFKISNYLSTSKGRRTKIKISLFLAA
jgi:hypothetical protein